MNDGSLRDEINKRLTLNWLIQGASQHAGMTVHHLVRDELDALNPALVRLYDHYALINLLQYWQFEARLLTGSPRRFWDRVASDRTHPFSAHPLLSRFGGMLAEAARQRAVQRCAEKGFTRSGFLFPFQAAYVIARLRTLEAPHRQRLVALAKSSTSTIWGIAANQLDAEITDKVVLGNLIPSRTFSGAIWRNCVVGYGGAVQRGERLMVVGKGTNWQLLTKELVKGTAELICLHGLNRLDDETCRRVLDAADWLEFEPWMLQTGGELWRRMLALVPADPPIAVTLMHLARLPPASLHSVVLAVLEQPEEARGLLAGVGEEVSR